MTEQRCTARDLTRGGSAVLLWCFPIAAVFLGLHYPKARLLLWISAFLVMGMACLANAARCGRLHCYVTGPLLMLAAAYVTLSGFSLLPMQPGIFLNVILGIAVLACLAEIPLGKYRRKV
jgi:hypothetical protein